MATAPMKSQPLHNFSLSFLKWGTNHPNNRSRNPPDTATTNDSSKRHHRVVGSRSSRVQRLSFTSSAIKPQNDAAAERRPKQKSSSETDSAEKPPKDVEKNETEEEEEVEEGEVVGKPWNLRPRKAQEALLSAAVFENHGGNSVNTKAPKSTRLREMVESRGNNGGEKKEKSKFWLTLSREEIEEDIFIMTGSRPARRPKKRPKNVQKQLDSVFPGLWLVGLTVDAYRAADAPIKK